MLDLKSNATAIDGSESDNDSSSDKSTLETPHLTPVLIFQRKLYCDARQINFKPFNIIHVHISYFNESVKFYRK